MPPSYRVIVQTRTTSHRLPGKAFLPLGGFSSALLCALRAANAGADVRVATSSDASDDELAALLHNGGAHVVRGPLDDVLARFVVALDGIADDVPVVRLTADNMLPDGAFVDACVSAYVTSGARVMRAGSPGDGLPHGVVAQIARAGDVRVAAREASDPYDREHVFPWLERTFGVAGFRPPDAPGRDEELRATLDTIADYLTLRPIVPHGLDAIRIPWQTLVDRLAGRTPGGVDIMATTAATSPVLGIDTTTYLVKEVERAKAFYRDTLGLPLSAEFGDQGCEFVFADNTAFSLWKMDDGSWTAGNGIMFSVADFEGTVERYRAAGVQIAPYTEDTPVCKMAFAEDSEGNTFIIHFRKGGRD